MLKRSIILLFVAVVLAGSISAQVRPGVRLGYNVVGVSAKFTGSRDHGERHPFASGYPDNFQMKSGFQGGMIADCPINDVLSIMPGARFVMQGFNDRYRSLSASGAEELHKFSLYYVQIPVYAQYRLNIAEETNLLFQAGPYAGIGIFGQHKGERAGSELPNDSDKKKIKFGNNPSDRTPSRDTDDLNRFDYGIGAGVGIEFYRFQLMLAYDFGLHKTPFIKRPGSYVYHVDMQNQSLSVTFAVIFGRRDPLQNQRDF